MSTTDSTFGFPGYPNIPGEGKEKVGLNTQSKIGEDLLNQGDRGSGAFPPTSSAKRRVRFMLADERVSSSPEVSSIRNTANDSDTTSIPTKKADKGKAKVTKFKHATGGIPIKRDKNMYAQTYAEDIHRLTEAEGPSSSEGVGRKKSPWYTGGILKDSLEDAYAATKAHLYRNRVRYLATGGIFTGGSLLTMGGIACPVGALGVLAGFGVSIGSIAADPTLLYTSSILPWLMIILIVPGLAFVAGGVIACIGGVSTLSSVYDMLQLNSRMKQDMAHYLNPDDPPDNAKSNFIYEKRTDFNQMTPDEYEAFHKEWLRTPDREGLVLEKKIDLHKEESLPTLYKGYLRGFIEEQEDESPLREKKYKEVVLFHQLATNMNLFTEENKVKVFPEAVQDIINKIYEEDIEPILKDSKGTKAPHQRSLCQKVINNQDVEAHVRLALALIIKGQLDKSLEFPHEWQTITASYGRECMSTLYNTKMETVNTEVLLSLRKIGIEV